MNSGRDVNLAVPFFSQRSNRYKDEALEKSYASEMCNITSLCMVLHYLGVTEDMPDVLFRKFLAKKYEGSKNDTSEPYEIWDNLKKSCTDLYNIDDELVLYAGDRTGYLNFSLNNLSKYLKAGLPVMFSYGILTKGGEDGHIAVLRGVTKDGNWILNDPWGDPTNAWGLINDDGSVRGVYVAREEGADITAGNGSGDNSIISKSVFSSLCSDPLKKALCILWAKQWCFFLRDSEGAKVRFGDESEEETTLKAQRTLGADLNFILTENGAIRRGIDLSAAKGRPVYSCGPGRIVAIRNTENEQDNFILVMHTLPGTPSKKVFMLYKSLAYIDLNREIKEHLYDAENCMRTWDKQLIQKIHTKAVIFDTGNKSNMDIHETTGLPERGIAYLVPQNHEVKQFAEHIEPGVIPNQEECGRINDINNYKTYNGTYIVAMGNDITTESRSNHLIVQTVNSKEYWYYRTKISQLISGEAVVFLGEDDDTITDKDEISVVKKDTFKSIFLVILKDIFIDMDFSDAKYQDCLDKIIITYQEKFEAAKGNESELKKLGSDFITKCRCLCRRLLETPWTEQTQAFSYKDRWYNGAENGSFTGLKQVYETIYDLFQSVKSVYNFGVTWSAFEKSVEYFYPANIDYFLEVTSGSFLGNATETSSVECFSVENILAGDTDMQCIEIEKPYNKGEVVSVLKKIGYLTAEDFFLLIFNYISKSEVEEMHSKYPLKDMRYILHVPNPLKGMSKNQQKHEADDAVGNMEILIDEREEPIFTAMLENNLIDQLKKYRIGDLSKDKLYFYNPVKIISYLYKLQAEQIEKLKE